MKIGIIIHSHTNNTLSVGQRLADVMIAQGTSVIIERISSVNESPNTKESVQLITVPNLETYDYVILGAPVWGFNLSSIMTAYLLALPNLKGKHVACFVTEYFPKPWMGGNHAIKQMVQYISRLDGTVTQTAVINWTSKSREIQIENLISVFINSVKTNL